MSKKENKIEPLRNPQHFGEARFKFRQFSAMVAGNLTAEDLVHRDYWVNFAKQLLPGDEIRCLANDGSFVAYLLVVFVQGTETRMKMLGFHKLENIEKTDDLSDDFEIKNGGAAGWYIKVKADGSRLLDKSFKSQAAAITFLTEYQKSLAA